LQYHNLYNLKDIAFCDTIVYTFLPSGKSWQAKSPTIFPVSNIACDCSSGGVKTLGLYFLSQSV